MNIFFPFIGVLIDECYDLNRTTGSTNVFTDYVDMVKVFYKRYLNCGLTEEELKKIRKRSYCSKHQLKRSYYFCLKNQKCHGQS